MPLYAMSNAGTIVTGTITLRAEADEPLENAMLFISGVLICQLYERPGSGLTNAFGVVIRMDADARGCEFDVDTRILPNGVHSLYTSLWRQVTSTIISEHRGVLNIQNEPNLQPVPAKRSIESFIIDGQRRIPRAMFGSHPTEFIQRPGLIEAYKAAGFNAIVAGVGINSVRDFGPTCTQQQFEDAQQSRIDAVKALCDTSGIKAIADMMDWTWDQTAGIAMLQPSWIDDAMKNTYTRMIAAGCFICTDICDETGFRWSEANQHHCRRFTKAARLAGMPVSWTSAPVYSATPNRESLWSEGLYYSDYLSLGRDFIDWALSGDPSVDQFYRAMASAAYGIRTDCPFIINVSCCDLPTVNSVPGRQFADYGALAEIGYAIVTGATGIKVYHLDTNAWKAERAAGNGQHGCDPDVNPLRWTAISHAMNVVAELEPLILQPQVECESPNRWFASRAWAGDAGRLQLSVSRLDVAQAVAIPQGYNEGFMLWQDGKTAIDMSAANVTVPPGGWLVMQD